MSEEIKIENKISDEVYKFIRTIEQSMTLLYEKIKVFYEYNKSYFFTSEEKYRGRSLVRSIDKDNIDIEEFDQHRESKFFDYRFYEELYNDLINKEIRKANIELIVTTVKKRELEDNERFNTSIRTNPNKKYIKVQDILDLFKNIDVTELFNNPPEHKKLFISITLSLNTKYKKKKYIIIQNSYLTL